MSSKNLVFATEGFGMNLCSGLKPAHDMQTDNTSFDEVSGELCRHTPNAGGMSSLCLLEIKKDMQVVSKSYCHPLHGGVVCQKILFNTNIMMPGSMKKDKVQVHMCKLSATPIILPTDKENDYSVVLRAKEISHYVTRVGMLYKIMLYIENCTLCTIYQAPMSKFPTMPEQMHQNIFVARQSFVADIFQQIDTVKITIGSISVDRYSEKFMTTMLFQAVPVPLQIKYTNARKAQGRCLVFCVSEHAH